MNDTKTKVSELMLSFTATASPVLKNEGCKIVTHYLECKDILYYGEFYFHEYDDIVRIEHYSMDPEWSDFHGCFTKDAARELLKSLINLDFMPF